MTKTSSLLCVILSLIQYNQTAFAEKLSQPAYDQFIAQQTRIVNETKVILDQPNQEGDAQKQRWAFCQRLTAYEEIQKVSEENHELNMAPIMAMIAKNFLDRQVQSMHNSGMTAAVFCKSRGGA
ncbi:hypothetical protein [Acinetobacter sp. RF14B]|uniref:hypothetical protein n=1 Tax=Acinetobacter sp. RF14B TaxID=2650965 RepID=UPI001171AC48|nr:hypothetical protein [Acinetobacter sp. RF14B]TQR72822.1 hypothetical protein E2K52_00560 [Acinetobacter sp. RF14B]